jgi:hypothetical protein
MLRATLTDLEHRHSVYRVGGHLVHRTAIGDIHLIEKFQVRGTGRSAQGDVLGVILSSADPHASHVCIAPFAAVREPKKLAEYLEKIGVVPPTSLSDLKLVATYVDAMARRKRLVVLRAEGLHTIEGEARTVAVIGNRVIGSDDGAYVSILEGPSIYAAQGTLQDWQKKFGPLLRGNPLMIVSVCFALAAPLGMLFGFKLMGLLLAGPSSIGKTTLTQLVSSTFRAPEEVKQWAGTANGIEALAVQHRDLPLPLDELGSGDLVRILEVIYRISGGVTKARATTSGALQQGSSIRSPIFANGEVSLHQQASGAGTTVRAGHDVRLPTIWVDEPHGVYTEIHDAADGVAFAARVNAAMSKQYGTVLPAFVEAILGMLPDARKAATAMRKKVEAAVAGGDEDVKAMSGIERRVLAGFVNFAVAGELAVTHKVLPLDSEEPTAAAAHVFGKWLTRWRALAQEPTEAPLRAVRDFFQRKASRFVPLEQWKDGGPNGFAGYLRTTKKDGTHFMVFPKFFEQELAAEHGVDATVKALRSKGLLLADRHGRTKLIRMPDSPERMSFYAVSNRIVFEQEG